MNLQFSKIHVEDVQSTQIDNTYKSQNQRTSPLATPSVTKHVLRLHGLDPKYSLGQNFLVNDAIIKRIIKLADVKPHDKVLEVGCGIGTLTLALLLAGADVLVVEKDQDMVSVLQDSVNEFCPDFVKNLSVINLDALKASKDKVCQALKKNTFKLVSNLPYNVAAPIVITYFQQFQNMESATVMVQKEIADRMCASPGSKNYGAYTVKLAMYAFVVDRFKVSSENFIPKPRVESAVVRLNRKNDIDKKTAYSACEIADLAFAHRRKTLANNIKLSNFSEDLVSAFISCNIDLTKRAEVLEPDIFLNIAQKSNL